MNNTLSSRAGASANALWDVVYYTAKNNLIAKGYGRGKASRIACRYSNMVVTREQPKERELQ